MERIPQSSTKRVMVKVYLTDGKTPAVGKTIPVSISCNGAAFANPSGGAANFIEVAAGWYYFDVSANDNGVLGDVVIRGEEVTIDPVERMYTVVNAYNAGFAGIPSAAPAANGGLPTVDGTKLNQTADLTAGQSIQVSDKTGFTLSASGVLAVWNVLVSSISVDGSIGKRIIDYLTGDIYTRIGANGAGLTALGDARMEYLDVSILSRLASEEYTPAPSASDIRAEIDTASTKLLAILSAISNLNNVSLTDLYNQARTALTLYDVPTSTAIMTALEALATAESLLQIKDVADKINTMVENRGSYNRFQASALEQAPAGSAGSGDATEENQLDIIDKLSGLMSKTHTLTKPIGNFTPATDSAEAIRDRGDIAWIGGGASQGSNTVTITVRDDGDLNVVDAAVEIYDSAGLVLYERKTSNSSGQVITNRDNGDYIVKVLKQGYSFDTTPVTVDGNTTRIITGTKFIIPAAVSTDLCVIYSGQFKPDGSIHQTLTPSVSIVRYSADNNFYAGDADGIWDKENNLVKFIAARGAVAILTIPEVNFCEEVTVPDRDSEQLEVILNANV